jgi:ATP-binding protein involved in chromosome partitioning
MIPGGEPPPISFADMDATAASSPLTQPIRVSAVRTLRQMLVHARLGEIDHLLVDLPPGRDSLCGFLNLVPRTALVVVTTPDRLAADALRRHLEFAREARARVLGVIENMVGFMCDHCRSIRPLFPEGDVGGVAREFELPVIGRLAFDPRFADASARGALFVREYAESPLGRALADIVRRLDSAGRDAEQSPDLSVPASREG